MTNGHIYPIQQKDGTMKFRSRGLRQSKSNAPSSVEWSSCIFKQSANGGGNGEGGGGGGGGGGGFSVVKAQGVQYSYKRIGFDNDQKPVYARYSRPCNPNAAPVVEAKKAKWRLPTDAEMSAHVPTIEELSGGTASPSELLDYLVTENVVAFDKAYASFFGGVWQVATQDYLTNFPYDETFGTIGRGYADTMRGDPFKQLEGAEFDFGYGEGLIDGLTKDANNE